MNSHTVTLRLTDQQEAAVHDLLRRAYLADGGAAVFAEIRRAEFPSPAGATLILGLVHGKGARAIQKVLRADSARHAAEGVNGEQGS